MKDSDREYLAKRRAALRVNKHRLDDELEVQAEIQEDIAQRVSALEAAVADAKDNLAKVEARLNEDFRDGERITKDAVEAKVRRHPDRNRAWEAHQQALRDHREFSDLLDAWKARAKDIQSLAKLFGDQYWALTSVHGPEGRQRDPRPPSERYERPNTREARALSEDGYLKGIMQRPSRERRSMP